MNEKTIKLIIAGGRDFNDYDLLEETCTYMLSALINAYEVEIVSGGAKGADSLAQRFARSNRLKLTVMNADWDKHGKSAGYKRNQEMANYATHVIAFWDGKSRGTKHMIDTAQRDGLKCKVVTY